MTMTIQKRVALPLAGTFGAAALAAACVSLPVQAQQEPTEYLEVAAQRQPCTGVAPMQCLQVRAHGATQWQNFHGEIAGFQHEPGQQYLLQVRRVAVENPPADRASQRLELVDVISARKPAEVLLAPFPTARKGQTRWVIDLPPRVDESHYKVELLPGRTMRVDCNRHWAGATITQETVQGWGYHYHVLKDVTPVASTMMACPGEAPQDRYVPVGTMPELQRYNSRLPIVFYTPDDVSLRYRVWRVEGAETEAVKQ